MSRTESCELGLNPWFESPLGCQYMSVPAAHGCTGDLDIRLVKDNSIGNSQLEDTHEGKN